MYKVLIVEDEDVIRKGMIFMVDWLRLDCVIAGEAANGDEGLRQIAALNPDIVITDIRMPIKDGLTMLAESSEQYDYEAIIISGYSEFEYAKQAISLGVREYLLKPIDFEELYAILSKLIVKIAQKRCAERMQPQLLLPDLAGLSRASGKYTAKMLNYIQEHYAERILLSDLSRQLQRSATYLNFRFKHDTGYTFNDFLNRYRVLQAVELLRQERLRMYEIAEAVGFHDYKYFIQVFKKYTGFSPGKFVPK